MRLIDARAGPSIEKPEGPQTGNRHWLPILLFVALTGLLLGAAFFYYRHEQERLRAARVEELQSVAGFNLRQLEHWLAEQQRLTRFWGRGSPVSELTGRWLTSGALTETELTQLREHLEDIHATLNCEAISVVDRTGTLRLQTADHPLPPGVAQQITARSETGWLDLYRTADPGKSRIHLDLLSPLLPRSGEPPIGALLFHLDPAVFLYPLIQSWPTPSTTAESLLVRRDSDRVLFLNELRHRSDTALEFSLPLSTAEVPAVQAALGVTGLVQGRDYRGEPVLAVISPVASVPWKLVAKIDQAEIDAPLRREAFHLGIVTAGLTLSLGAITWLWWRRQRLAQKAHYWQSELEQRILKRRLDYLARYAHDIILLIDADGHLVDCNDRALIAYGYDRSAMIGKPVRELLPPERQTTQVEEMLHSAEAEGLVYETVHRRKSGETFPVEVSARHIEENGEILIQEIVRDITERRRAEAKQRLAERVFEGSDEGILVTDPTVRIVAVNPAFTVITGYAAEEVLGKNPRMLSSGRQDRTFFQAMWATLAETDARHGEIWNRRKNGEIFPEWLTIKAVKDDQGKLLYYVGIFADITERKAAFAQVEFMAHHDPLTGLPNRDLLHDRIETAIAGARRARQRVGVLFIDLDRFKLINDSFGHLAGDQALCHVAERLQQSLRAQDTVSRLAGDEFVVVLNNIHIASDAARVAEKIIDSLKEPMLIDEHRLTVTVSIGITVYPEDGTEADRLVQNADTAMYRAKSHGRNTYGFFTPDLSARALERLFLENELRQALAEDQFEAYYQPQLAISDGRLIGFEALIRWRRPHQGLTFPEQFVPIAEETGLMLPIGERMLELAGRQLAEWHRTSEPLRPIAINLSAKHFRSPDLVDRAVAILECCEVSPQWIELEVTESLLMAPADIALTTVRSLKAAGFRLALDDFGTGYSNLNYLKRFAFDTVKIDRSFVSDLPQNADDAAIVKAILGMADALGFQVVAEGVETQEQLDFLAAHGCPHYQGFFASKPLPTAEASRFLHRATFHAGAEDRIKSPKSSVS